MNYSFSPSYQVITGRDGFFQQALSRGKKMTVQEYETLANSAKFREPACDDDDELEAHYWIQIQKTVPLYGAEGDGTLFNDKCENWNLNNLGTILDHVEIDYGMVSMLCFVYIYKCSFL